MANFYASYPITGSGGGGGGGSVTSIDVSGGGTGLTTSGGPVTTSGTITIAGTVNIAHGGTNSTTALNNNRVIQSSAGKIVEAAAITASRALASDANGIPVASATTATELGFVSGVTSSIQTQINALQPAGNYITALTGDVTATGPGSVAATIANLAVTNAKIANATIDLTAKVTGILPIANGGTNSSTALNNSRFIVSSAGAVVENAAVTGNRALASTAGGLPVASTTTDTELGFVSGVTSSIQTQLNGKQATGNYITALTGDVTATGPGSVAATIANLAVTNAKIANATIDLTTKVTGVLPVANGGTNSSTALSNNRVIVSSGGAIVEEAAITANRALASNASGLPVASTTTDTELGFVSGVTSSIQTQLNGKQATGNYITALTGDVTAAGPGSSAATLTATTNATITTLSALTSATSLSSVDTITTGTWNATTIAIAHGGTGQVTAAAAYNALSPMTTTGDLEYEVSANTAARLPIGTAGQLLTVSGGVPAWVSPATSGTVTSVNVSGGTTGLTTSGGPVTTSGTITLAGTLVIANGGTGQTTANAGFNALSPMTTLGDTIYEDATPKAVRLAGNTTATKNFLVQTGTGTVSAAPSWGTIAAGDVPTLNQNTTGSAASFTGNLVGDVTGTQGATVLSATSNGTLTTLSALTTATSLASVGTITTGTWNATTIAIAHGGTGQTTKAAAFDALAPTTTKGDLIAYSTTNARVAVGTDGQLLTADSTAATGVSWQTSASSLDSPLTALNYSFADSVAANALTIALKDKSGADPSSGSPVKVAFRNSADATGTYSVDSVTAATSIVVPSGATLGQSSGVETYIWVYGLDNAGTLELAVSSTRFDDTKITSTTAITSGSTSYTTLYSTTARSGVAIRLLGRLRTSQATAGTWTSTADRLVSVTGYEDPVLSAVYVDSGNGTGSTNTNIRRYSNNPTTRGTAITYADSATLGGSFTINEDGLYCCVASDKVTASVGSGFIIVLNSTVSAGASTFASSSANNSQIVAYTEIPTAATFDGISGTVAMKAGDVVRVGSDSATALTGGDGRSRFSITQVYKN